MPERIRISEKERIPPFHISGPGSSERSKDRAGFAACTEKSRSRKQKNLLRLHCFQKRSVSDIFKTDLIYSGHISELFQEIDHLDSGKGAVVTFVPDFGAGALDRLFYIIRCQNAEEDRNACSETDLGDSF